MANRDIVVVGASAGGVEALSILIANLPPDLPAAVLIAWHCAPFTRSALPEILERAGKLAVAHAIHGERVRSGKVYVAPPDHHMVLEEQRVRLTRGPRENRFRPAIDPLFRSAAYSYGPRVVGVILSGALDDGTAGLWAIKDRGGKAIVQEPTEARQASMPISALHHVEVDFKLPVAKISRKLIELTSEAAGDEAAFPVPEQLEIETTIARGGQALQAGALKLGEFSPFTCPECHGVLMQIRNGSLNRFRCHTGHAYSTESLLATLGEKSEDALWNALRAREESVMLLTHLSRHASEANRTELADFLKTQADEAQARADTIRRVVSEYGSLTRNLESDRERYSDTRRAKRA